MKSVNPGRPWPQALVRRAVRSRAVRLAVAIAGVAASSLLVLVLASGFRSVSAGVEAYAGQQRIDLWVAPAGTDNLIRSSGLLPASLVPKLAAIDGVESAEPMLRGFVAITRLNDPSAAPLTFLAMGYRAPDGLGGPPTLAKGRRPERVDEVVLDRAAAHRLGAEVDETVTINDRPFRVVGLSTGTNLLATQFVFLDERAADAAAGALGNVSFVGIDVSPDADAARVRARIEEQVPTARVFDRSAWVRNNVEEVAAGLRPLLTFVSFVGVVSATLLVALLVQGAVDDRRRDIAVLLALGTSLWVIARGVVLHVLTLVVAGTLAGVVLTHALEMILDVASPMVELVVRGTDVLWVVGLFGGAGILAGAIPLLRLRRIDPAEAFRP